MRVPTLFRLRARRSRLFSRLSCFALLVMVHGGAWAATPADDPAWRSFQHALGEPAMIAANADHPLAHSPYRPVPDLDLRTIETDRFRLGFALFHEGRLSSQGGVACITCHAGPVSGVDGRRVSIGVGGARGTMNSLSLFNAAFNFRQFWDGRAVTLEDQALVPIETEVEMANTLDAVLQMLQADVRYPEMFSAVYPDGVTIDNMADAMAYFQRINFVRRDTPFQRQLLGREDGLSEQAQRGWRRFEDIGCASCHNGINLGGNSYQQLGEAIPYYGVERDAGPHDDGILQRSGREHDRHAFRVPSLQGVATTAPYFHDGSVATLNEAIEEMAEHQLGLAIREQDVEDIAAFLRSLHGPYSNEVLAAVFDSEDPAPGSPRADPAATASHHDAYLAAADRIGAAAAALLVEMQRIDAGEIPHFDFVQFEHVELIRHARALRHPPSALPQEVREAMAAEADALLDAVNELEWTLADFLRAEAMIRVFAAMQDNPDEEYLTEELGDIDERVSAYREVAAEAMHAVSESAFENRAARIHALYRDHRGDLRED